VKRKKPKTWILRFERVLKKGDEPQPVTKTKDLGWRRARKKESRVGIISGAETKSRLTNPVPELKVRLEGARQKVEGN